MIRRKLFSLSPRRKLFSLYEGTPKMVKCGDCGYEMETTGSPTTILCPKCGGRRFNVLRETIHEDRREEHLKEADSNEEGRVSLFSETARRRSELEFQKNFSEPSNDFEYKLKKYSGKTITKDSCERIFGVPAGELIEKRYASVDGIGNLEIAHDAFPKSKLFSKLIISVTKIMDLDPEVTCGSNPMENKVRAIQSLETSGALCPKSIIMIKKAHGIDPEPFSGRCIGTWAEDSGILNDLPAEFGGSSLEYPSFKRTIEDRYPDAPSDILDLLKSRGIIRISGDRVNVL